MQTKFLEIRDRMTQIPAVAIEISGADGYLALTSGYTMPCILLTPLGGGLSCYDAYDWNGSRTMKVAHEYIQKNWHSIKHEDVIDVEFILGETVTPKSSGRFDNEIEF